MPSEEHKDYLKETKEEMGVVFDVIDIQKRIEKLEADNADLNKGFEGLLNEAKDNIIRFEKLDQDIKRLIITHEHWDKLIRVKQLSSVAKEDCEDCIHNRGIDEFYCNPCINKSNYEKEEPKQDKGYWYSKTREVMLSMIQQRKEFVEFLKAKWKYLTKGMYQTQYDPDFEKETEKIFKEGIAKYSTEEQEK